MSGDVLEPIGRAVGSRFATAGNISFSGRLNYREHPFRLADGVILRLRQGASVLLLADRGARVQSGFGETERASLSEQSSPTQAGARAARIRVRSARLATVEPSDAHN